MDRSGERVLKLVEQQNIRMVHISFADMHGVSRGRYVPIGAYLNQVREGGMEFSNAIFVMDTNAGIASGTSIPMNDGFPNWKLVVDETTFAPIPWRPGEARVLADMVMPDGQPVDVLPRQVLKRVIRRLAEQGLTAQAGTEHEFYLLERDGNGTPRPADPLVQYNSELEHIAAMRRFDPLMQGMREMGIQVEAFGEEYAPSQYEVNLRYQPSMQAADEAFTFKQAVKEMFSDPSTFASFMSKPFANANGCGCHIHLSVLDTNGHNVLADASQPDGLSRTCKAFIGGLLTHAPALMALTNPTVNCYKRAVPGRFAPVVANWGYDNRTCVVRVAATRGAGTHIEYRAPSGLSNPYIALAATLAAGLDGIQRNLDPGDPELPGAPATGSATLPQSLPQALAELEADDVLQDALGVVFVRDFIAIKRHEATRYMTAVTQWEWDEYLRLY